MYIILSCIQTISYNYKGLKKKDQPFIYFVLLCIFLNCFLARMKLHFFIFPVDFSFFFLFFLFCLLCRSCVVCHKKIQKQLNKNMVLYRDFILVWSELYCLRKCLWVCKVILIKRFWIDDHHIWGLMYSRSPGLE